MFCSIQIEVDKVRNAINLIECPSKRAHDSYLREGITALEQKKNTLLSQNIDWAPKKNVFFLFSKSRFEIIIQNVDFREFIQNRKLFAFFFGVWKPFAVCYDKPNGRETIHFFCFRKYRAPNQISFTFYPHLPLSVTNPFRFLWLAWIYYHRSIIELN